MRVYDQEKETQGYTPGDHDNLGVHPERREAEVDSLKKQFNASAAESDAASGPTATHAAAKEKSKLEDTVGKGFNEKDTGTRSQRIRGSLSKLRNKKVAVGGAIGGAGASGLIFAFMLSSGPLQLMHLGKILDLDRTGNHNSTIARSNSLFRYWKTGDFGETRLGYFGSKTFRNAQTQLKANGIEFVQEKKFGNPRAMTIDPDKNADLKGLKTDAERKAALEKRYPGTKFERVGGKWATNTRNIGITATRGLFNNSLTQLESGKIVGGLKLRAMAKFYNQPSLFHPIKKAEAAALNKASTADARRAAKKAEEDRKAGRAPPESTKLKEARAKLKEKVSGLSGGTGALLIGSTIACTVRNSADAALTFNREAIVDPAVLATIDLVAAGDQGGTGQDLTATQYGAVVESLIDENGESIWNSKPLKAKTDPTTTTGEDIPFEYSQAYVEGGSASKLADFGGTAADVACSPAGLITQFTIGIGLLVAAAPTGGASILAYSGIQGAQAAASAGIIYMLSTMFTKFLQTDASPVKSLSGPLGGSLAAFSGREIANMEARASGGSRLSSTQSAALDVQYAEQSKQEFQSKNFATRMFDTSDYRSVASKIIDSNGGSAGSQLQNVATGTLNFGAAFSKLTSLPTAKASAAAPYNWGFSRYGFSDDIINDTKYEDPYANADQVAALLNGGSGSDLINRAEQCFGVVISQKNSLWAVTAEKLVNPNTEEYEGANCSDNSENWTRLSLFVMDSRTMDAIACYEGEEEICGELGVASGTTESQNGGSTFNLASYNIWGSQYGHDPKNRAELAAKVVTENQFDIFGVQEMIGPNNDGDVDQFAEFQKNLSGTHDSFGSEYMVNGRAGQRTIYWDNSRFTKVSGGVVKVPSYGSNNMNDLSHSMPWVKLQDTATQQTFHVVNVHLSAWSIDGWDDFGGAFKRERSAQLIMELVNTLNEDGSPVFLTGDMNSVPTIRPAEARDPSSGQYDENDAKLNGDRSRLPYCIFTNGGVLKNVVDMAQNRPGGCGGGDTSGIGIDTIYATPDNVSVSKVARPDNKGSTDHSPFMAKIVIAGSGGTGSVPYTNPVFSGNIPDPSVLKGEDGVFHIYATGNGLQHLTSKDMVNWKRDGAANITGAPAEATGKMWAPDIEKVENNYVLTWAGTAGAESAFSVHYGTSSSAGGPFKYGGKLASPAGGFNAIDPQIFNNGDGKYYLYYTHGGNGIFGVELNVNGTVLSAKGSPVKLIPFDTSKGDSWTVEAPEVVKKDGTYYMYFSTGQYLERADYKVKVAKATSPLGSFTRKPGDQTVLSSNANFVGPGQNSVMIDNIGNEWTVYHARRPTGSMDRHLMLDPVTYAGGWPVINGGSGPSKDSRPGPAVLGEGGKATVGKGAVGADGFPGGNCVDFAKYILSRHFPGYSGDAHGDGADFAASFGKAFGLTVDHTPAVHAVVSFPRSYANPIYGHVGFVAAVNADGSILVEESNWSVTGNYGTHVVPKEDVGKLIYAHTETKWN